MKVQKPPLETLDTNLRTIRNVQARVHDFDWLLRDLVKVAREQGATWKQIGEYTGVSAQAAWQRYRPEEAPKVNPGQG